MPESEIRTRADQSTCNVSTVTRGIIHDTWPRGICQRDLVNLNWSTTSTWTWGTTKVQLKFCRKSERTSRLSNIHLLYLDLRKWVYWRGISDSSSPSRIEVLEIPSEIPLSSRVSLPRKIFLRYIGNWSVEGWGILNCTKCQDWDYRYLREINTFKTPYGIISIPSLRFRA